jgi:Animal haem peroxidase
MNQPKVSRPHGGVRGANLSRSSVNFDGPFGRIFRALPPGDYGKNDTESQDNLTKLAIAMSADPDQIKDGPDAEEGGIPAAYTYFGQFIDHDLTFDPASSLQKQNDPDALVDYRTPRFDMDNIYGRGPDDQPYMFDGSTNKFILGAVLDGDTHVNSGAHDLPRSGANPARAIIGDPRNDENALVSQLQGLWHRFHNAIVDANPQLSFTQVQQVVRFHYQWILVHDFLPTIVHEDVLGKILPTAADGKPNVQGIVLKYFHPRNEAFMPLEFSAAAYRFGHSMVRPSYRLNDAVGLIPIFATDPAPNLRGFRTMTAGWAIDWRRFIDLEPLPYGFFIKDGDSVSDPANQLRLQLAYKLDTSLVNPLKFLPTTVSDDLPPDAPTPANPNPPNPLAELNLKRGWRMRLPTGQSVAKAMGLIPLTDEQILIGKFTDDPDDIKAQISIAAVTPDGVFKGNCPLWAYVLAETRESPVPITVLTNNGGTEVITIKTRKLGPVGGTIVAETFLGLLLADSSSYISLDPLWKPPLAIGGEFGLREMFKYALGIVPVPKFPG